MPPTLRFLAFFAFLVCVSNYNNHALAFAPHANICRRGLLKPATTISTATSSAGQRRDLLSLAAKKKKRRRRKVAADGDEGGDDVDSQPTSSAKPPPPPSVDDLPDFDLDEDGAASSSKSSMSSDPSGSEISSAMMSTGNRQARSIDQLIADRSLEKTFEFDEPGDESLPDLALMAKENEVGKKAARREARVAAAIARKEEEESITNPLENIPFLKDEKGEVSGVKILEAGTWLGITLLVFWEIYINSPFFERVEPQTPLLY